MTIRDQEYYRRRIDEEVAAAGRAVNEYARSVHLDLVERYSQRLRDIDSPEAEAGHAARLNLPIGRPVA